MMAMHDHSGPVPWHAVKSTEPRAICAVLVVLVSVLPVFSEGMPREVPTPDGGLAVYWYVAPEATRTVILGHGYLSHARSNMLVIDYLQDLPD